MFFLLNKRTDDAVFDDFPKISDYFPKIFKDFPKLFRRPDDRLWIFPKIFLSLPKIAKDCRRRLKKIRSCFDHTPTNFSVVKGTKEKCCQI